MTLSIVSSTKRLFQRKDYQKLELELNFSIQSKTQQLQSIVIKNKTYFKMSRIYETVLILKHYRTMHRSKNLVEELTRTDGTPTLESERR